MAGQVSDIKESQEDFLARFDWMPVSNGEVLYVKSSGRICGTVSQLGINKYAARLSDDTARPELYISRDTAKQAVINALLTKSRLFVKLD